MTRGTVCYSGGTDVGVSGNREGWWSPGLQAVRVTSFAEQFILGQDQLPLQQPRGQSLSGSATDTRLRERALPAQVAGLPQTVCSSGRKARFSSGTGAGHGQDFQKSGPCHPDRHRHTNKRLIAPGDSLSRVTANQLWRRSQRFSWMQ
ncbi:MAG: hypothetical protein J07HR59_01452 [Halorubrum sp. J07HR59]|nr:MAG: hypothetical protein J07HR59_01452 [Halorubrum sp. J07HR59]